MLSAGENGLAFKAGSFPYIERYWQQIERGTHEEFAPPINAQLYLLAILVAHKHDLITEEDFKRIAVIRRTLPTCRRDEERALLWEELEDLFFSYELDELGRDDIFEGTPITDPGEIESTIQAANALTAALRMGDAASLRRAARIFAQDVGDSRETTGRQSALSAPPPADPTPPKEADDEGGDANAAVFQKGNFQLIPKYWSMLERALADDAGEEASYVPPINAQLYFLALIAAHKHDDLSPDDFETIVRIRRDLAACRTEEDRADLWGDLEDLYYKYELEEMGANDFFAGQPITDPTEIAAMMDRINAFTAGLQTNEREGVERTTGDLASTAEEASGDSQRLPAQIAFALDTGEATTISQSIPSGSLLSLAEMTVGLPPEKLENAILIINRAALSWSDGLRRSEAIQALGRVAVLHSDKRLFEIVNNLLAFSSFDEVKIMAAAQAALLQILDASKTDHDRLAVIANTVSQNLLHITRGSVTSEAHERWIQFMADLISSFPDNIRTAIIGDISEHNPKAPKLATTIIGHIFTRVPAAMETQDARVRAYDMVFGNLQVTNMRSPSVQASPGELEAYQREIFESLHTHATDEERIYIASSLLGFGSDLKPNFESITTLERALRHSGSGAPMQWAMSRLKSDDAEVRARVLHTVANVGRRNSETKIPQLLQAAHNVILQENIAEDTMPETLYALAEIVQLIAPDDLSQHEEQIIDYARRAMTQNSNLSAAAAALWITRVNKLSENQMRDHIESLVSGLDHRVLSAAFTSQMEDEGRAKTAATVLSLTSDWMDQRNLLELAKALVPRVPTDGSRITLDRLDISQLDWDDTEDLIQIAIRKSKKPYQALANLTPLIEKMPPSWMPRIAMLMHDEFRSRGSTNWSFFSASYEDLAIYANVTRAVMDRMEDGLQASVLQQIMDLIDPKTDQKRYPSDAVILAGIAARHVTPQMRKRALSHISQLQTIISGDGSVQHDRTDYNARRIALVSNLESLDDAMSVSLFRSIEGRLVDQTVPEELLGLARDLHAIATRTPNNPLTDECGRRILVEVASADLPPSTSDAVLSHIEAVAARMTSKGRERASRSLVDTFVLHRKDVDNNSIAVKIAQLLTPDLTIETLRYINQRFLDASYTATSGELKRNTLWDVYYELLSDHSSDEIVELAIYELTNWRNDIHIQLFAAFVSHVEPQIRHGIILRQAEMAVELNKHALAAILHIIEHLSSDERKHLYLALRFIKRFIRAKGALNVVDRLLSQIDRDYDLNEMTALGRALIIRDLDIFITSSKTPEDTSPEDVAAKYIGVANSSPVGAASTHLRNQHRRVHIISKLKGFSESQRRAFIRTILRLGNSSRSAERKRALKPAFLTIPYVDEATSKNLYILLASLSRYEPDANIRKIATEYIELLDTEYNINAQTLFGRELTASDFAKAGSLDFKSMTPEEIAAFAEDHGLDKFFEMFGDDLPSLIDALSSLHMDEFRNRNVIDFVKAYKGLDVTAATGGTPAPKSAAEYRERRHWYLEQLLSSISQGMRTAAEEAFERQLAILITLSRISFEENPDVLIAELDSEAARQTQPFIKKLYESAASHFRSILDWKIVGMETPPYGYHKEGAHFMATRRASLLADEAGMGKTYQVAAALETLALDNLSEIADADGQPWYEEAKKDPTRRILYVTTASTKENVREEILAHSKRTTHDTVVLKSGNPLARRRQIQELNGERYVITNYESLVSMLKNDPEAFEELAKGIDTIVIDEAQMMDNPRTLRTQAIQKLTTMAEAHRGGQAIRKMLLSASPYQTKPETMWTLLNYMYPDIFPDFVVFRDQYCKTTDGLRLLNRAINSIVLRRTKPSTLSYFEDPKIKPFADQLSDGIPRIPRSQPIDPQKHGSYDISEDQAHLIAWMVADFEAFVAHFNTHIAAGDQQIDESTVNPLLKMSLLQKAIYDPEYFGLDPEDNPYFDTIDARVTARVNKPEAGGRGQKIILWAWNTHIIDELVKRYSRIYGENAVARIDGKVLGETREVERRRFQEDDDCRILVANFVSGGQGLTFTAAHADIFVQLPDRYTLLYQADGRKQRLIGPKNIRHAKATVETEYIIPRFSEAFLKEVENDELRGTLSHGTIVEQTHARLEGGEILFRLAMDGHAKTDDLEQYFRAGIIESLGLKRGTKIAYSAGFAGAKKRYADAAQALLPLWRLTEDDEEQRASVVDLLDELRLYPLRTLRMLGKAYDEVGRVFTEDFDFIKDLLTIKNRYIRQQMLSAIPSLIKKLYPQGQSLKATADGLQMGRLTPASFVAQMFISAETDTIVVGLTAEELDELDIDPQKRSQIEEHLFIGVFGIIRNSHAEAIIRDQEDLLGDMELEDRVMTLYRLGLLARTRGDLLEIMAAASYDSPESLAGASDNSVRQAVADFADRSIHQVHELVESTPHLEGRIDYALALIAGWMEDDMDTVQSSFAEVMGHILDKNYDAFRYVSGHIAAGNEIDYLSDNEAFWKIFAKNDVTKFDSLAITSDRINRSIVDGYEKVVLGYESGEWHAEGTWVKRILDRIRRNQPDYEKLAHTISEYQSDLATLGTYLSSKEITDEVSAALKKYGISPTSEETFEEIKHKLAEIKNITGWLGIEEAILKLEANQEIDFASLRAVISKKIRLYRALKYEDLANQLDVLRTIISKRIKFQRKEFLRDVTVEDTDDPAIIMRMGALHPDIITCMNPNGNPTFTQFVPGMLGSKNMKMIIVRDSSGDVLASARLKVKRTEHGKPVLFLESLFSRKGYDFKSEIFAHIHTKATRMQPTLDDIPQLMETVPRGDDKSSHPWVHGTGCYTENEYVEPVFRLRRAASVAHRGRIVEVDPQVVARAVPTTPIPGGGGVTGIPGPSMRMPNPTMMMRNPGFAPNMALSSGMGMRTSMMSMGMPSTTSMAMGSMALGITPF